MRKSSEDLSRLELIAVLLHVWWNYYQWRTVA